MMSLTWAKLSNHGDALYIALYILILLFCFELSVVIFDTLKHVYYKSTCVERWVYSSGWEKKGAMREGGKNGDIV